MRRCKGSKHQMSSNILRSWEHCTIVACLWVMHHRWDGRKAGGRELVQYVNRCVGISRFFETLFNFPSTKERKTKQSRIVTMIYSYQLVRCSSLWPWSFPWCFRFSFTSPSVTRLDCLSPDGLWADSCKSLYRTGDSKAWELRLVVDLRGILAHRSGDTYTPMLTAVSVVM